MLQEHVCVREYVTESMWLIFCRKRMKELLYMMTVGWKSVCHTIPKTWRQEFIYRLETRYGNNHCQIENKMECRYQSLVILNMHLPSFPLHILRWSFRLVRWNALASRVQCLWGSSTAQSPRRFMDLLPHWRTILASLRLQIMIRRFSFTTGRTRKAAFF